MMSPFASLSRATILASSILSPKVAGGELDGIELTGIIPGFDPTYQTYTFVEGAYLYFVHQGNNTFDIALDKYAAAYLSIDTAGIVMEIEVNGAGDNTIIIVTSNTYFKSNGCGN